jgi:hypothetical protein
MPPRWLTTSVLVWVALGIALLVVIAVMLH